MCFPFDFGWYSLHFDIRMEGGGWGGGGGGLLNGHIPLSMASYLLTVPNTFH